MTNRIQEHKIIAMQAVIFVSLLLMLSFILDGCALRKDNIDKIEIENKEVGKVELMQHTQLIVPVS